MRKLKSLSNLLSSITKIKNQPWKPVVGSNSFTHESGIHIDGLLKSTDTYEPFTPALFGSQRQFTLGKHSGKMTIEKISKQKGIPFSEEQLALLKQLMTTDNDFQG